MNISVQILLKGILSHLMLIPPFNNDTSQCTHKVHTTRQLAPLYLPHHSHWRAALLLALDQAVLHIIHGRLDGAVHVGQDQLARAVHTHIRAPVAAPMYHNKTCLPNLANYTTFVYNRHNPFEVRAEV